VIKGEMLDPVFLEDLKCVASGACTPHGIPSSVIEGSPEEMLQSIVEEELLFMLARKLKKVVLDQRSF